MRPTGKYTTGAAGSSRLWNFESWATPTQREYRSFFYEEIFLDYGLQAPGIWWMQCFATKSWKAFDERLKLSLRLDGHNLPWKHPNLAAPNTTYNLNSVTSFARFSGVLGDFSNFGTGQANVQMSVRAEF